VGWSRATSRCGWWARCPARRNAKQTRWNAERLFFLVQLVEEVTGPWSAEGGAMLGKITYIPQPGDEYLEVWNVAAMHDLLNAAFMSRELPRFCRDRALFRPVLAHFPANASLSDMADVLIEYCQTRLLFPELMLGIQEVNPRQYKRYRPHLHNREGGGHKKESRIHDVSIVFVSDEDNVDTTLVPAADTISVSGYWWG